jgi:hypothetical protein
MEKNITARSFISRVYRADTEDRRKITGLIETLDSAGKPQPFRDIEELTRLLNRGSGKGGKRRKKGTVPFNWYYLLTLASSGIAELRD